MTCSTEPQAGVEPSTPSVGIIDQQWNVEIKISRNIIHSKLTSSPALSCVWVCVWRCVCVKRCVCVWRSPLTPHSVSPPPVRCYLLDGISKGAWLNRSSIIFAGTDKWSVDPRVSIVSSVGDKHEYSLQIQKVDVTDDGQYTCSIQSERNLRPKLLNLVVKGGWEPTNPVCIFLDARSTRNSIVLPARLGSI